MKTIAAGLTAAVVFGGLALAQPPAPPAAAPAAAPAAPAATPATRPARPPAAPPVGPDAASMTWMAGTRIQTNAAPGAVPVYEAFSPPINGAFAGSATFAGGQEFHRFARDPADGVFKLSLNSTSCPNWCSYPLKSIEPGKAVFSNGTVEITFWDRGGGKVGLANLNTTTGRRMEWLYEMIPAPK